MIIRGRFQKIRPGVGSSRMFHEEKIEIRRPTDIHKLIEKTGNSNPDVRWHAVYGLRILKDPKTFDALVKAVKDPDAGVRQEAILGLAELKLDNPEAVRKAIKFLAEAKKDPELWVQQAAEQGLKSLRMKIEDKKG